ncbi:sensor histidine kinase, partial [Deinococcus pimensis]|uniref:sensor histidine kinase n=1 Tax=Deinococcus pimensis TaxID=309888 RepID=UPI0005EBABB3
GRALIEVLRDHRLEDAALTCRDVEVDLAGRLLHARGVPGGLIVADVTERRERERELREVAMVLSHEFRTPVTAIKGLLEAVAVTDSDEIRERFVNLSLQETGRLERLVEDLAVEFRPRARRTFEFGEAARRVLRLTGDEFERRGVRVRVRGARVLVRCDPDKLVQVLINLLENAARHGPNPGDVTVTARADDEKEGFVSVRVTDGGARLPDYEGIFASRTKGAASRGSGLGLSIVTRLVRDWRGRVWGRHTGRGNEFGFTVPAGQDRREDR